MGKRKIKKLFEKFQNDIVVLEELLKQNDVINGGRNLSFSEKAAILRNIEAEDRTHLAWTRTWAAIVALVAALILAYLRF